MGARVLVTDGEQRAALAVVRSLGRAGHRVWVASEAGRSLAGASRYAAGEVAVGSPLADPGGYLERLAEATERWQVEMLIPVAEPALLAVLGGRDRLGEVRIPFPELETFRRASDKAWVAEAAREVGLAVPAQSVVRPGEVEDLPERAERETVLKPARSVQGGRKLGVSYVARGGELRAAVAGLPPQAFPLLVQERVTGAGAGIFLLRWEGRTLAAFAHRRIREKPPSGGVSVLRESVALDPERLARSEALLDRLGWRGVAMVELKGGEGGGPAWVMEINGRFWGSLQLAVDAGVDFPAILVEAALGSPRSAPPSYRAGVRTRWLLGDLDHLLLRLTRSSASLELPPGAPGRLATAAGFLGSFGPGTRTEVLRPSDPRPFLRECRGWLGALLGRS